MDVNGNVDPGEPRGGSFDGVKVDVAITVAVAVAVGVGVGVGVAVVPW